MRPASVRGARRSALGVLLVALLAAAAPARGAEPGSSAKPKPPAPEPVFFADVMVLHATNGKKGIDPRIGPMPELGEPPFSSYENYSFLERARLRLEKGAPSTLALPDGGVFEARLLEVVDKDQLRLSTRVAKSSGKASQTTVRAKLNKAFMMTVPNYKKGILVLVIRAVR